MLKKNTKVLVIAITVILLCLIAISGATYALFVLNVDDGKIGINTTSGNLSVDIIDDSENPSTLVGEVLDFVIPEGKEEILFEPGAAYYTEGFRVKNNGNIPLNFILYISEDGEDSRILTEAFEVFLTQDPSNREGMTRVYDFDGRLEPGQSSDVYYLVFRMKESAGNEFQGRTFTGVGITVCAVQGNALIG